MIFKTTDFKLADDILLANKNNLTFIVPSYQREFVWEPVEIINFIEAIDVTSLSIGKYIGHFILDKHKRIENSIKIVDGQQRITAFSLILKYLLSKNDDWITQENKEWIESVLYEDDERKKTRLNPKNPDQRLYYDIMFDRDLNDKDEKKKKMYVCYEAIKERIDVKIKNKKQLNTFIEKMKNVAITCKIVKEKEDARIIYADINSKSHKMSNFDMMRSYVTEDDNERIANEFKELEAILTTKSSKNTESCREAFFGAFVKIKADSSVSKTDFGFYREFVEQYPEESLDAIDVIREMQKYAKIYKELVIEPKENPEEGTRSYHGIIPYVYTKALDIEATMPLLMRLVATVKDGEMKEKTLKNISNTLTSYLIRGKICGDDSKGQSFENMMCKAFSACEDECERNFNKFDETFKDYVKAKGDIWDDDDVISHLLKNEDFYSGGSSKSFVNLVLCSAEIALSEKESIDSKNIERLPELLHIAVNRQIDHILPKNLSKEKIKRHGFASQTDFDKYKFRIGNVGLLTPSKNNDKSRDDEDYFYNNKDKTFEEVNNVVNLKSWTSADIEDRSQKLANAIVKAWPDISK